MYFGSTGPKFYLNFDPQCHAVSFSSVFVGDVKCFPSSNIQIKYVKIQNCASSRIPFHWNVQVLNEKFPILENKPGYGKQKRQKDPSPIVSL